MLKVQNDKFKVSIIGTGFVGSSIAYALMLRNLANKIILIDKNKDSQFGEKLDLDCKLANICTCNIISGEYKDIKDSDIIIVTSGRSRKQNETRLDMIVDNINIAKDVTDNIKKYYNGGIILIISNPVDIITYKMNNWLGLPRGKVFGTGCSLDSLRFVNVISEYIGNESNHKIDAMVIGEHGDSQIPLWSKVFVDDLLVDDYCNLHNIILDDNTKFKITNKVIKMGMEIIKKKGRTNYGIATCTSHIVDLIKNNKKQIISTSVPLNGEYDITDVSLSLPCVVGANGIEKICCYENISLEEKKLLKKSADNLKNILKFN